MEAEAAARRLRSLAIFSARVRRRRISGRRLGADIKFSLVFSDWYSIKRPVKLRVRDTVGAVASSRTLIIGSIGTAGKDKATKTRRLLRPKAAADQNRKARILRKPRILKRKFTPEENRPTIRLDPARMVAVLAEAGVGGNQRAVAFKGHAGLTKTCGSRTCKPNSVCRCRQDGHSSGPRITAGLKRPTRRLWRTEPARVPGKARRLTRKSLPIWSCSVWGLPCPPHYCVGGALLPHLFTLT